MSRAAVVAVAAALAALCVVPGVIAGCAAKPAAAADPDATVGPAPLRRLANDEYLNALGDLFPTQQSTLAGLPALPADTVVAGFDDDAVAQAPSDVLIARYAAIADLYAAGATTDDAAVTAITGCADWSTPDAASACAAAFLQHTGARLFRRPLTADEQARFAQRFAAFQGFVDFPGAVQLTLSSMLQSPQFLYRAEPPPAGVAPGSVVPVEAYAMASRLSFFLWQSVPDDALYAAAAADALHTPDQIRAQAERMLGDDRARRVYWSFHREWLGLDRILDPEHLVRTPDVDPDWTAATQASAYQETELFVENTLLAGGTLGDLLGSRNAWVDGEMARVYGLPAPADPTTFAETVLPVERAGLYTRVAYLAGYSHAGGTSPPVRGNAIESRLLCQLPGSPPPGADLSAPMNSPDAGPETTRTLFAERTSPPACSVCHVTLNGYGFGLEEFSASGAHRTTDDGLPVDDSGAIHGTDVDRAYAGAVALSSALAGSRDVHACATASWLRYALGRAPVTEEAPTLAALTDSFYGNGGGGSGGASVRALLLALVTTPSFRMMRVEAPSP